MCLKGKPLSGEGDLPVKWGRSEVLRSSGVVSVGGIWVVREGRGIREMVVRMAKEARTERTWLLYTIDSCEEEVVLISENYFDGGENV